MRVYGLLFHSGNSIQILTAPEGYSTCIQILTAPEGYSKNYSPKIFLRIEIVGLWSQDNRGEIVLTISRMKEQSIFVLYTKIVLSREIVKTIHWLKSP